MSRARTYQLIATKHQIALNGYRREAGKLLDELKRLDERITQIGELSSSYREHLALPALKSTEARDVLHIMGQLHQRRELDQARGDILRVERNRLSAILAEKKRQIERLEDAAKDVRKQERLEREERQELLMPARRS
jgi:hypothetical protein